MSYVDELLRSAREALPEEVFRYYVQGAGDGVSAAEAPGAWERFRFVPRVLHDVTTVHTTTSLLGTELRSPFAIAPTTLQRAAHPDGEVAMARGASAAGSLLVVSSNAGTPFVDIAATGCPWWLQIYVTADRSATSSVVERAVEHGARALVLTADTPVVGTKDPGPRSVWDVVEPSWLRANFAGTTPTAAADKAKDLGPQDIAWLTQRYGLPVVVKGVLHPTDALRCIDAGSAAVWVSNHGGRQLDRAVPTPEALGEVAEAVGDRAELYVDGGATRGADAVVAAALGARAVFLGRPPLYALAVGGADGVSALLDQLRAELVEALRLVGATTLDGLPDDLLQVRGLGCADNDRTVTAPTFNRFDSPWGPP